MADDSRASRLRAFIIAIGLFMAGLDTSAFLTALPTIAESFGVSPIRLSLAVAIYLTSQVILLPASSWIADRYGPKRVFAISLIAFSGASALAGFSETLVHFVVARGLQGVAASFLLPVGRILLIRSTPRSHLVTLMTITTSAALMGPMLGPAIGGFISTYFSWHWIFFINIPVGAIALLLVIWLIKEADAVPIRPFDFIGYGLVSSAFAFGLFALERISAHDSNRLFYGGMLVVGLIAGGIATSYLGRHSHPVISLAPLKIKTFRLCVATAGSFSRIALRGLPFVLPLLFQLGLGISAFATGILLLLYNLGDVALKPFMSQALRKTGYRTMIVVSGGAMAATMSLLLFPTNQTPVWIVGAIMVLAGMMRSFHFTGLTTLGYVDVPDELVGSATVVNAITLQVTAAVSVSVATMVMNISIALRDAPLGEIDQFDCQMALSILVACAAIASIWFSKLDKTAGAEASGHAHT